MDREMIQRTPRPWSTFFDEAILDQRRQTLAHVIAQRLLAPQSIGRKEIVGGKRGEPFRTHQFQIADKSRKPIALILLQEPAACTWGASPTRFRARLTALHRFGDGAALGPWTLE